MRMSDHIKQRVLQEFFANKVSFSWKTAKLDSFVLPEWENQHTYRNFFYLFAVKVAWHTVLTCCTMCGTEQPKEQPQIGDRGSNPVAINQFLIFFSIRFTSSRFLFHLLIFFILHSLFNLI